MGKVQEDLGPGRPVPVLSVRVLIPGPSDSVCLDRPTTGSVDLRRTAPYRRLESLGDPK